MAFIDYYKILGVSKDIPQKDVRAAYRKRAKMFHPDLHPNDPKAKAKFQALNEAYEVISDPDNVPSMTSMVSNGATPTLMRRRAALAVIATRVREQLAAIRLRDLTLGLLARADSPVSSKISLVVASVEVSPAASRTLAARVPGTARAR